MTTAQLRKELAGSGADPFEVAALAMGQVERLVAEVQALRSEIEVLKVGVDGERRLADFERYRKRKLLGWCGA